MYCRGMCSMHQCQEQCCRVCSWRRGAVQGGRFIYGFKVSPDLELHMKGRDVKLSDVFHASVVSGKDLISCSLRGQS
jgi:hypothetical protein